MNKYFKIAALGVTMLVVFATFTTAQNVQGNSLPITGSKFRDVIEVNFNGISSQYNGLTMGIRNVFALKPSDYFSIGLGVGLEDGSY